MLQAGSICLLALSTLDCKGEVRPKWILGDVFMPNFYTMFDLKNKEIGIAHLALCFNNFSDKISVYFKIPIIYAYLSVHFLSK